MLRRIVSVIGVAAVLTFGASGAANALDGYPPPPPDSASLAGSSVVSDCDGNAPWITFDIVLHDPDGQVTTFDAVLVMSADGESVELPLGTLVDGRLSGRVLWPGASVDGDGEPTGWPGWAFENGEWVETSGNYAWTRGAISAMIRVNPELDVPLAYPPQSTGCADPAVAAAGAALPLTGGALPVAALGAGLLLLGVGGATLAFRRRRATR